MANQNQENDIWIDDSLRTLSAKPCWAPNPDAAWTRLGQRQRARRSASRGWIWTTAVTSCVTAALFLFPAPRACAQKPGACVLGMWRVVAAPHPQPVPAITDFTVTGSPTAPITVEICVDHACPSCEALFRNVLPEFTEKYVRTGKARIVYRLNKSLAADTAAADADKPGVTPFLVIVSRGKRYPMETAPTSFEQLRRQIEALTNP